jgi:hypothetical protein
LAWQTGTRHRRSKPHRPTPPQKNESPTSNNIYHPARENESTKPTPRASSNHQRLLVLHRVSWLVIAILLLGALAAPISASWNRLVVTSPQPGILQLVETGLWPRTRRIRLADYGAPVLTQYEFRSPGSGYGTPMPPTRSWGWILVLPPIVSSAPTIEFWLRARKHPTAADDPPAEEIAEFVDPLKKLIALSSSRIHPSS